MPKNPARYTMLALVVFLLIAPHFAVRAPAAGTPELGGLFRQDEAVIAVVDSGLGGLAAVAELSRRFKSEHPYRKVRIIFQNALFAPGSGYNSLTSREKKIKIFDNCLDSLHRNHHPDVILIACNTLSVLYGDTAFAKKKAVPVIGVVETGLKLIAANLKKIPAAQVAILGTETTMGEGAYQKRLAAMGFAPGRIIAQACPELQSFIERGFDSEETSVLISAYADEVVQKMKKGAPLLVSLNCTHYGYAIKAWRKAFAELECPVQAFLDPTPRMVEFIFQGPGKRKFKKTTATIEVVSMVPIARQSVESLGRYFKIISPETARALAAYKLRKNLFEWKNVVK